MEGASTYIYRPAKVSKVSSAVAISAGGAHSAVVTFREDLITFGKNDKGQLGREGSSSTPSKVDTLTYISEVSAGEDYTVAMNRDGEAYVSGANNYGQLGVGDKLNKSANSHPVLKARK